MAASLFFIQSVIRVYTIKLKLNIWVVDIIIYCLFYYIIFKIKPYKHHYLSIVLIIIIGLILDLALTNIQNDLINNFPLILLRLLREILYSVHGVINKYIMEKKYCSVYELSSCRGIFTLIFLGIFALLDYYLFLWDNNLEEYFDNFDYIEILIGIGIILFNAGLELSTLFTIKINTPCHVLIISEFMTIASNIIYIKYIVDVEDTPKKAIIMIICYIIIIFFSLVFNEILEINCFKLSENTRRNIMEREKSEDLTMLREPSIDINEDNRNSMIHLEMNDVDSLVDNEIYN